MWSVSLQWDEIVISEEHWFEWCVYNRWVCYQMIELGYTAIKGVTWFPIPLACAIYNPIVCRFAIVNLNV